METLVLETVEVNVKRVQEKIFDLINGIQPTIDAEKNFLGIMAIRFGREHQNYNAFCKIIKSPQQQWELLNATDKHEYKGDFRVFCHTVLKNYISEVTPSSKLNSDAKNGDGPRNLYPEKDFLLQDYFEELERCSQQTPRLLPFDKIKLRFEKLQNLEHRLLCRILNNRNDANAPIKNVEFTPVNYRQILTTWLMYPELIYFPDRVEEVIALFEKNTLTL